ncbi:uncharacterized transmembrane protein DDB_G0289901-like [Rhagoletis pomonella]|uniref:uncharacterized transmembrane protein DDB_G0289901-like n=1 Tax=Rhagoletis pomonella TaxID=28610 RepID=UPI001783DD37|nr:uncharacterized transmembrane protein DDB_G0289901-like [Rhagoletis pomonella]
MRLFTILFCIITTSWANPILKLFHEKSKEITLEAKACCGQGGAIIHGSIGAAQVPAISIHTNLGGLSATGNLYNTQAHSSGVHSGHLVHAAGGNSASAYNHFETNERPILNYGSGNVHVHNVAVAGAGAGAHTSASLLENTGNPNLAIMQGGGASFGAGSSGNVQLHNVAVGGAGAGAHTSASLLENAGNPSLAIMQGGGASFGAAHGQSASGWNVNGGHNNYGGGETFGNSAAAAAAATSAASSWNQQNGGHQNTGNGAFSHSTSSSWSSSHSGTAK